jgi:hypothetical protein
MGPDNKHVQGAVAVKTGVVVKWFVCAATVGMLVPVVLTWYYHHTGAMASEKLLYVWPTSIILITDPTRFWDKLLIYSASILLNAALYGGVGVLLGVCVDGLHARLSRLKGV